MLLLDLYMDSRISFKIYFLIILFIHKSIGECQNAKKYSIPLQPYGNAKISQQQETVMLTDGNINYKFNPLTLEKTYSGKASFKEQTKSNPMPSSFMAYCNNTCDYQCIQINQYQVCGFTGTWPGCPIISKESLPNMNYQKCIEHFPLIIFYDLAKNIGYQLMCWSSKWNTWKRPLEQLNFMATSLEAGLEIGKFSILASTHVQDSNITINGICEYDITKILATINNSYVLDVEEKENNWHHITKNKFESMPEPKVGLILNKNPTMSILDMELQNENIKIFETTSLVALDNKTYQVYYLSTSKGKIIKAITGDSVNFFYDLWCNIEGEVRQIKIWDERLLVLTTKNLYSLPLHNCSSSLTCTKCIQARDPHCFWHEKLNCTGITGLKQTETYSLKQDIINGNAEKFCPAEFELNHTNVQEIINKLTLIEKSCSNKNFSSVVEKVSEKDEILTVVKKLAENCSKVLEIIKPENSSSDKVVQDCKPRNEFLLEQPPQEPSLLKSKTFITTLIVAIISLALNFFFIAKNFIKKETGTFNFQFKRNLCGRNPDKQDEDDCNIKSQNPGKISARSSVVGDFDSFPQAPLLNPGRISARSSVAGDHDSFPQAPLLYR